ncbi:MAG: hypothetical protein B6D77_03240 [gamma proteobacterium symbiont of Ctena orbiculata]|nr:MAG: hypothetical protein B6D77_03240 [gamma proteobacterium symbiont of Ctena orbiculata]PVV18524.1 MAG: hypothetical protein B6D78_15965 [gamma proteobacterium symbiont of Ctena orbiculata]
MKAIVEIIKQLVPMIIIVAIAGFGYLISQFYLIIDFVDDTGNILWRSVFLGFAFLIAGYIIYRLGVWLWSRE